MSYYAIVDDNGMLEIRASIKSMEQLREFIDKLDERFAAWNIEKRLPETQPKEKTNG